jgi:hypothetical protein
VNRLLYLYGFVDGDAPFPEGLLGVGNARVRRLELGAVAAAVGDVPAEEFAADAIETRMRDLAWIGDQGALHERIVTWFVDHGGILPARLLTLYSGEAALREAVPAGGDRIRAQLERMRGLREWDLKVSYRDEVLRAHMGAVSEEVAELERASAAADPGRRYLLERKRERLLDSETGAAARRIGEQILAALQPLARDVRRVPSPRGADPAALPVVVHAALLVPEAGEAELQSRASAESDRLAPNGISVALTGPWASYRFLAPPADSDDR